MLDKAKIVREEDEFEFISLVAGGQSFCMELDRVREIRRWEPITMIPHSPKFVLGVVNLRGTVVPIVDLAMQLGFERIHPTGRSVIIISSLGKQIIGFLVDSVSEILAIKSPQVQEAPSLGSFDEHPYLQGVLSIGDEMVRMVNIDMLMAKEKKYAR